MNIIAKRKLGKNTMIMINQKDNTKIYSNFRWEWKPTPDALEKKTSAFRIWPNESWSITSEHSASLFQTAPLLPTTDAATSCIVPFGTINKIWVLTWDSFLSSCLPSSISWATLFPNWKKSKNTLLASSRKKRNHLVRQQHKQSHLYHA